MYKKLDSLETNIKRWICSPRTRIIFISVFVIGLFVHGSMFFNNYLMHDDLVLNDIGGTYSSGRWLLHIMYLAQYWLMGSNINAKAFITIISFALIGLICCLIDNALKFKKTISHILLGAIIVTFPYVTKLFCYTFTANFYYVALLMTLVAALLVEKPGKIKSSLLKALLSVILLGLSMAVYQTSLCAFIAFLSVLAIKESLSLENESWKSFFIRCFYYISVCALGCAFYFLTNKIALFIKKTEMIAYQGLDHMTDISFPQLLDRVVFAFKEFFFPNHGAEYNLYNTVGIRWCYRFSILIIAFFVLLVVIKEIKIHNTKKAVQLILLCCIIPFSINSVFLTASIETTHIYALMMFAEVFFWVCVLWISELFPQELGEVNDNAKTISKIASIVAVALVLYESAFFGYSANVLYTEKSIAHEQTIGYYNRLISRIQSLKGYKASMLIAYIGGDYKDTEAYQTGDYITYGFDNVYAIDRMFYKTEINEYNWKDYMQVWCGFAPEEVSEDELAEISATDEVKQMPTYPDEGSIKIIDDVVVVKFAEP